MITWILSHTKIVNIEQVRKAFFSFLQEISIKLVELEKRLLEERASYIETLQNSSGQTLNKTEIGDLHRQSGRTGADKTWDWEGGSSQSETQHFDYGHTEALGSCKNMNQMIRKSLTFDGLASFILILINFFF